MGFLPKLSRPALCAMIHVGALPGTPAASEPLSRVVGKAAEEARILADAGVDMVMIENMHDAPYMLREVGPEIVAGMTAAGLAVREACGALPLGVQVLAGANEAALAVALACGAQFIRAEGFVFGHVGDEGYHDACAGPLLRYRRAIGAPDIAILADIKKKHSSHAVTADVSLAETAHAAEFFGADGLIVTGASTGDPARPEHLAEVRGATRLPVLVGSGVTPDNAAEYGAADAFIVGSALKKDGHWANALDRRRIAAMVKAVAALGAASPGAARRKTAG